jgi:hypothetical protein
VIRACFVHSWCCISGNSSAKITELTTSSCLILQTVRINAFGDYGGFQLRATTILWRSTLRTHAVCYTVNWPQFPSIWIYSHPTASCFIFLPLPVLRTIFKCASWVQCLVAALAASWGTSLYLRCCCVRKIAVCDIRPANLPVFNPLSPGRGDCVSMMCWCGIGEEDDNERKWEALRTI